MRIPQTDSIKELAEFWDKHSITDVWDELEEVTEPLFENRITITPGNITVPLSQVEAESVKTIARHRGLSPAELIHEWVVAGIEASRLRA